MKKLIVTLDWLAQQYNIGELSLHESRGQERYQFVYTKSWIETEISFAIDPALMI